MKKTIVYECFKRPTPKGKRMWFTYDKIDRGSYLSLYGFWAEYYPEGHKLTVTITIEEPGQPTLDDEAAGKLNTFMNGGA